jgi:hypothetical protein
VYRPPVLYGHVYDSAAIARHRALPGTPPYPVKCVKNCIKPDFPDFQNLCDFRSLCKHRSRTCQACALPASALLDKHDSFASARHCTLPGTPPYPVKWVKNCIKPDFPDSQNLCDFRSLCKHRSRTWQACALPASALRDKHDSFASARHRALPGTSPDPVKWVKNCIKPDFPDHQNLCDFRSPCKHRSRTCRACAPPASAVRHIYDSPASARHCTIPGTTPYPVKCVKNCIKPDFPDYQILCDFRSPCKHRSRTCQACVPPAGAVWSCLRLGCNRPSPRATGNTTIPRQMCEKLHKT